MSIRASFVNWVSWQRVPASQIEFKDLNQEIIFLLGYAVFYIIAGYLLGVVIVHFPIPMLGAAQFNQDIWYSLVFKIFLLLIIPSYLFFVRWNYTRQDLLLGLNPSIKNVIATFVMVVLGFFLNATHLEAITANLDNYSDAPLRLMLGIFMPLLTAAIPEEFFFRVYLQTRLEKKWNRLIAILLSTTLFTAWHLPSRYLLSHGVEGQAGDWGQVMLHTGVPVFIIGFIFALLWSRHRNIILLVLTHWAIDILPAISSFFKIPF
jgi:membrane protease YdiL (CAAX protease family)